MVVKNANRLRQILKESIISFKDAKTLDEKLAIANYIGNLYSSIICMGEDISFDKYHIFGGERKYEQIFEGLDDYNDELAKNFLINKRFHSEYFRDILPDIEKELIRFSRMTFDSDDNLSRKDFFEIVKLFMDSIGLGSLFDELYKNGKIYSSIIGQDQGNLGFTLYNPTRRSSNVFVKDLKYDLHSMNTLVHEFGHVFDLDMFDGDVCEYNRYFYLSLYGEVISKLFERLLFRFLIKNNICSESAKDKLVDFNMISHDYILLSYLLSCLSDKFIKNAQYIDCDSELLANKVAKNVLSKEDIINFFERMGTIDLSESLSYAYGDVISLFLLDEVDGGQFTADEFSKFLKERTKTFDPNYIKDSGFTPKEYVKLHRRENELIK